MKKRLSMIAAALTSAIVISMAAVTAVPALADTTEQYVTEEDGVTVVYITTYSDDPNVMEQTITWYDANGTKFVNTIKHRQASLPEFTSTVTWKDAAGNTYVRDEAAGTVSVYDSEGNLIAVMPANK